MDGDQHGTGYDPVADDQRPERAAEQAVEQPEYDPVQAVEQAVAGTSDIETLPVAGHVARFEAVHGALSDALNSIDEV